MTSLICSFNSIFNIRLSAYQDYNTKTYHPCWQFGSPTFAETVLFPWTCRTKQAVTISRNRKDKALTVPDIILFLVWIARNKAKMFFFVCSLLNSRVFAFLQDSTRSLLLILIAIYVPLDILFGQVHIWNRLWLRFPYKWRPLAARHSYAVVLGK